MPRALLLAMLLLATSAASADPVRFQETVKIEGIRFRVPMQVELDALTETRVRVRVTGDLEKIQLNLPAFLSRHIENTCERRISVAVTDARAEAETIRLSGQLQAVVRICREVNGEPINEEMLRQTASVETVLGGELVDGCLVMRVIRTTVRPDGLTGALMNATGYTAQLNRDLERKLDEALTEDDNCIDLPAEFRAFDAVITSGGFRDIGEGTIGAFIEGEMEINAANFIRLIELLGAKGKLGD